MRVLLSTMGRLGGWIGVTMCKMKIIRDVEPVSKIDDHGVDR